MMLRLTLDMIPRGDERAARRLGTVEIENDQTGDEHLGNYKVRRRGLVITDVTLEGRDRREDHWRLVSAAISALLGPDLACGYTAIRSVATPEQLAVRWPDWVAVGLKMRGRGNTSTEGIAITYLDDHQLRLGEDLYYLAWSGRFEALWEVLPAEGQAP